MPQIHRRRSVQQRRSAGITYGNNLPALRPRRGLMAMGGRRVSRRKLLAGTAAVVVVGLLITGGVLLGRNGSLPTGIQAAATALVKATDKFESLAPRATPLAVPAVTPEVFPYRDISFGTMNVQFTDRQINIPSIAGKELLFSSGTGSLDSGSVLKNLYVYNLNTDKEEKVATAKMKKGEIYETVLNEDWIVWAETDHHTYNYIYVKDRRKGKDGKVSRLKNCKNGVPKLKLDGNTLIWMEHVDKKTDKLYMMDLDTQENMELFTFNDVATYGVSAPTIYDDTVVWAGPDSKQTSAEAKEEGEHSTIFWLKLDENAIGADNKLNTKSFSPGTYVHEPLYNGKVFVWIDGNKSPNSKLYLSEPSGTPKIIAEGVTTYGLGDGVVVFGQSQQIWAYVIETGEICRLTGSNERGMLPCVNGRTAVWYNLSSDSSKDALKYKILTDEDLGLTGSAAEAASTPSASPTASAEATHSPEPTAK